MTIMKRLFRLPHFRHLGTFSARRTHSLVVRDWTYGEEPLEDYEPSGYHPVAVGDVLSHYRVLRKLGWGVYSTVWLLTPKFGALKVLTGLGSSAPELHELEYLQRIRDSSLTHPGHSHVVQLLDHFYYRGPNGRHLCLVMDVMGQDMSSFARRCKYRRLPANLVRVISRQLLLGLDYLHQECDIIHTDIKPANILFVPPGNVSTFFEDALGSGNSAEVSTGRNPEGMLILRTESQPMPYPLPHGDVNFQETWNKTSVKLADVGVACWADKVSEHFTNLIQSPELRAPEVCIGAGWGKPADVWSLGCTYPLLAYRTDGDYPIEMIKRGEYSDYFYNDDGSLKIPMPKRSSLRNWIYSNGPYLNTDVFLDFLQLMLTLDPDKRPSCRELLNHEWLRL
ncbi:kinase-like domain-containing protein [Gymnopilus junonius]|uniref:non-specific serine/threonine protein kinase n=1 Tax=Gymnopilus junonius TaxID=109634 RepID=A0A9P5NAS2_GYMJU|nr:kinase-like domain-containing protein [Gymnopilus junonius]